jgi:hypothetical protein
MLVDIIHCSILRHIQYYPCICVEKLRPTDQIQFYVPGITFRIIIIIIIIIIIACLQLRIAEDNGRSFIRNVCNDSASSARCQTTPMFSLPWQHHISCNFAFWKRAEGSCCQFQSATFYVHDWLFTVVGGSILIFQRGLRIEVFILKCPNYSEGDQTAAHGDQYQGTDVSTCSV